WINLDDFGGAELESKLLVARVQRVLSGMLAQHQAVLRRAYRLRRHDLVAQRIAEHAVLVNAGLMRKRVASHDRLIWLHRETDNRRQQLTRLKQQLGSDPGLIRQAVRADPQRHADF